MFKGQSSAILAMGTATATTRTLIDTITTPATTKAIIGIWAYACGGAGITTLEGISGTFDLDSPDYPLTPLQLPLDIIQLVGSVEGVALKPTVWNVNIPVNGTIRVLGYVTLDLAQTIAHKARFGLLLDAG
jgi:hypothetical protein